MSHNNEDNINQDNILGTSDSPERSVFAAEDVSSDKAEDHDDYIRRASKKDSTKIKSMAINVGAIVVFLGVVGFVISDNISGLFGDNNAGPSVPLAFDQSATPDVHSNAYDDVYDDPYAHVESDKGASLSPDSFMTPIKAIPTKVAEQKLAIEPPQHFPVQENAVAQEFAPPLMTERMAIQDNVAVDALHEQIAVLTQRLTHIEEKSVVSTTAVAANTHEKNMQLIMEKLADVEKSQAGIIKTIKEVEVSVVNQKKQIDNAQANARIAIKRTSSGAPQSARPVKQQVTNTTQKKAVVNNTAQPQHYILKAIVQNQAWVQNSKGETVTVSSQGSLPGMGKAVRFDPENFKLCFDNNKCIGG